MRGSFPQGFIESVRHAGDLVRLISEYVPLKQAGARWKGLCPFHQEKTPSFSVDPNTQLFYCFGCQTGGDAFKFLQLYEKLSFPEAVQTLADRWGVPLPERTAPGRDGKDPLKRLYEINRIAASFFRDRLREDGGRHCREYLARRGLDDDTAERLGVGYAPDSWEALRGHLQTKRYRPEELLRAGLVLPRKSGGGEYDRFRNRLIFPIEDASGRVIAFGGRALKDEDEPKYLNSPETPVYKKGEHLYGFGLAREGIRREGFAVIVEGYLDLAALLQAGFDNAVASLGTAFTASQARLLARHTKRVVFSYDGDAAGAKATERSLDLLLEQGFEVRVAPLDAGLDPDDFIRENGAAAYGDLLRSAPGYLDFLVRREVRTREIARIEEKVAAVNAVLPHVAKVGNRIERANWASRLADAFGIEDRLVIQELDRAVRDARGRMRHQPVTHRAAPSELEARLVNRLLALADERERWCETLDPELLEGTVVGPIVRAIFELTRTGEDLTHARLLDALEEDGDRDLLTRIAFREEPADGATVEDCVWSLERRRLARDTQRILRALDSEKSGAADSDNVNEMLLRMQELARRRNALA